MKRILMVLMQNKKRPFYILGLLYFLIMAHEIFSGSTIGFIIPSYVASQRHYNNLRECIRKIRKYHTFTIVIIDDYSFFDISHLTNEFDNVIVELALYKGAGEMNSYVHYFYNKYFDLAIIIHDSMHLHTPLENITSIQDVKLMRHFQLPSTIWKNMPEPDGDYNRRNAIRTHDDLILHLLSLTLNGKNDRFGNYCRSCYFDNKRWVGCFGIMSVISHSFLQKLQHETNILDFVWYVKSRRERMAMESIFGIACTYIKGIDEIKKSYDGEYIPNTPNNVFSRHFEKRFFSR